MKICTTHRVGYALLGLLLLSACDTNPAKEEAESSAMTRAQEITFGNQVYAPLQQTHGGQYNADPTIGAYVKHIGKVVANASDHPELPYDFVVTNNAVPNAWMLPGGKIAISRGLLLHLNNEAELAAVLGHEIAHAIAQRSGRRIHREVLFRAGYDGLAVPLGGTDNSKIVVGTARLGAAFIRRKYSQEDELAADKSAMRYMLKAGYDPRAAVSVQEAFVKLDKDNDSQWRAGLFATHPPSQTRASADRRFAGAMSDKGALGGKQYQASIAHLLKAKPAYAKYRQGQQALSDRKYLEALKLANEAIAIEPDEALFYGLKGDALAYADKLPAAKKAYDTAIEKNPELFYFYMKRGLVREQLKQPAQARKDLLASTRRLPTAVALNHLGNLQLQAGDKDNAIASFRLASTSKSIAGQRAGVSLARLELPIHPEKYLEAKPMLTQSGTVGVTLINHSRIPVTRSSVDIAIVNIYNNVLQKRSLQSYDSIAPGGHIVLDSKLLLPGHATISSVRTKVTYAEVAKASQ